MNMKRIVFAAAGIFIMLVIIAFSLHSITHIDEINQKRRESSQGENIASQIIATTATTNIWESLRSQETEVTSETAETFTDPEEAGNPYNPEENPENTPEENAEASQEETNLSEPVVETIDTLSSQ